MGRLFEIFGGNEGVRSQKNSAPPNIFFGLSFRVEFIGNSRWFEFSFKNRTSLEEIFIGKKHFHLILIIFYQICNQK